MDKLNARWGLGIYLGVREKSGEMIVAGVGARGIKYTRTVKTVPKEKRWESGDLEWVTTVPWNRGVGDDNTDGELPEFDVKHRGRKGGHQDERHAERSSSGALDQHGLRQAKLHGQARGMLVHPQEQGLADSLGDVSKAHGDRHGGGCAP